VQGGTEKEGRKLLDLAHWLPLGNDAMRAAFADELAKRGHADAARRERELLLKTSRPGSFHVGEVMRRIGVEAYHQKDYAKAADGHELAMLRVLRGNVSFVEAGAYVGVPHFIHRTRACGLVVAGQLDEARREIDLCLALQPANIELAVLLVPELEKRGHPKEADELLQKMTARYEQLCREHPRSASHHNSLAWMLACCRRQLDQALEHASKAVELAPEQAGYLDTLAEVHFQRGETGKALALMKKCIEMEPKRGFFRKQLKRFEAGDPKADLPSTLEDD
jgi:tetratricopeptide (TPR) repeat protein